MVNDSVVIYRHHQFTARDKKLNQFTAIVTVHTYHLLIGPSFFSNLAYFDCNLPRLGRRLITPVAVTGRGAKQT
jgi:hypothetical protein